MTPATALRPELAQALAEYLLAVADDELILGHRHSEWTGFGPDVESDVALSSIAQEEMGHARLFYRQVLALDGRSEEALDAVVFDRPAEGFRNAVLLERPNTGTDPPGAAGWKGDWGFSIVRLFLYELADAVRLDVLSRSAIADLPAIARTLQREEKYHRLYAETWLARLAGATAESHARIQAALEAAGGQARGLFEPTPGEAALREAGLLAASPEEQLGRWRQQVAAVLAPLGLHLPDGAAAAGGRLGVHSPDLAGLLDEMTAVRRADPGARW